MSGKSHAKFCARWQMFSPPPQQEVPPSNTAAWVQEASSDVCAPPAIAQLVEHLTVECCSNQMVPGSIPGGRIFVSKRAPLKSVREGLPIQNLFRNLIPRIPSHSYRVL